MTEDERISFENAAYGHYLMAHPRTAIEFADWRAALRKSPRCTLDFSRPHVPDATAVAAYMADHRERTLTELGRLLRGEVEA